MTFCRIRNGSTFLTNSGYPGIKCTVFDSMFPAPLEIRQTVVAAFGNKLKKLSIIKHEFRHKTPP